MVSRNLAIMFTDMKGFTARTSRQTRAENEAMLQQHYRTVNECAHTHGGTIVKSLGDSFLLTFESSTNAVLCGVAIQQELAEANEGLAPEERIELRITVSSGDVRLDGEDVYGEPVNIASRLQKVAKPGQVVFTDSVFLTMNRQEISCAELGEHELPGIPYSVKVYGAETSSGAGVGLTGEINFAKVQKVSMTEILQDAVRDASRRAATLGLQLRVLPARQAIPPVNVQRETLSKAVVALLRFALGATVRAPRGSIQIECASSTFRTVDFGYTRSLLSFVDSASKMRGPDVASAIRGDPAARLGISFPSPFPLGPAGDLVRQWNAIRADRTSDLEQSFDAVCRMINASRGTLLAEDLSQGQVALKLKLPAAAP